MKQGLLPLLLTLTLSACGGGAASNASKNDKVLEDAIALEKKTNAAVNATIAQIEADSQAALNLQTAEEPPKPANATSQ